jgi:plastocyanin
MTTTLRSQFRAALLASGCAAIALGLAACGGGASSSSSPPAPAASGTTLSSGGGGTSVPVTLKSFSITMGNMSLKPGSYTFDVSNAATIPHNLTIDGPGVANKTTGNIQGGQSGTLTVTLRNGKYDFFCSIPGHKQAGMNVEVTVGSGGGSTSSSASGSSGSSGGGWS